MFFYNEYIASHPEIYGPKFDIYKEIQADVGNVSHGEIMKQLDDLKRIRNNFVKINLLFDTHSGLELEESPSMTIYLWTSTVGGTLILWIGVTTTFLMKIVELLYLIVLNLNTNFSAI